MLDGWGEKKHETKIINGTGFHGKGPMEEKITKLSPSPQEPSR